MSRLAPSDMMRPSGGEGPEARLAILREAPWEDAWLRWRVELVAGVLGQQHHPDLVHVRRQGLQQGQQPSGSEHRHVVHIDLVPGDAGVVDAQQRQHRGAERGGELLGLPPHRVDCLVEGVAVVPGGPVEGLGEVAVPGFGVD
jgi:hypothetical protein